MKPYFEFYSDLDLILKSIEELKDKCHEWWINDTPFSEKEPNPEIWAGMEDALQTVEDMLNDEPFFNDESE